MPLSDIVKELNRSYNVKIHIADEQLTHNRFYALFNRKEQTIYNVLDIITATNQVRYKVCLLYTSAKNQGQKSTMIFQPKHVRLFEKTCTCVG